MDKRYIVLEKVYDEDPKIKGDFDTYDDAVQAIVNNHSFIAWDLFGTETNEDGTPITKEQIDEKVRNELNESIYCCIDSEYLRRHSCGPYYEIKEIEANEWND